MQGLDTARLDRAIEASDFSCVVQVSRAGHVLYARAAGLADRSRGVSNGLATRFALASGTKGLTALTVAALVQEGAVVLDAPVQPLLGPAADLLGPGVTLRQLLGHTSGIGDYLDESSIADIDDYVLAVPGSSLAQPSDYLPLLRGHAPQSEPGTRFAYNNAGYVVLALLIEALAGQSYFEAVATRVCQPAGLVATEFLRLDALPADAAVGYLPRRGWRSNEANVPVRGAGDGGAYSTLADLERFWSACFAGRIVPRSLLDELLRPGPLSSGRAADYGLGFWLARQRPAVFIEGSDQGISMRSSYEPASELCASVLGNTSSGAWPVLRELEALLAQRQAASPGAGG